MKRPERKKKPEHINGILDAVDYKNGYNQACDAWKVWLPSEEEIEKIIQLRYFKLMFPDRTESDAKIVASSLAKAISKRLRGEE